jgi:hypothetical protein
MGSLSFCHRPRGIMDEPLEKSFIQEMREARQKQLNLDLLASVISSRMHP